MNKIKKLLITAMLGTLAFSTVGCKMIEKTPEAIQKTVIAKVGNEKITKGDLDKLIKPYMEQYAQQYGEDFESNETMKEQIKSLKTQAVGILVDEKILLQKAEELNLVPEQEELDRQIAETMESDKETYGGEEAFNQALEASGLDEESYKEFIKKQIITQLVIEDMTKDVNITEDDIKKHYDENPNEFTEADISHILVTDEAQAKEIKEKLDNGGDFEALAKEFSIDGSKDNGGSLGVTKYNTLVPEFVEGLNSIKEGEISEPVQSQYGYHIIKYKDAKVTPFDDVKDSIKIELEGEEKSKIYDEKLEEWNKELKVKIYEDRL